MTAAVLALPFVPASAAPGSARSERDEVAARVEAIEKRVDRAEEALQRMTVEAEAAADAVLRTRVELARAEKEAATAADELAALMRDHGLRVDVDGSDSRMQNKIRLAQEQKVPYMVVLGDREIEAREGTLRRRGAEKGEPQETLGWDVLAARLAEESRARSL